MHIAAAMAAWWWLQVVKQRRLQPTMIRSSDALQTRFLMIVNRFRQRSRTQLMRGVQLLGGHSQSKSPEGAHAGVGCTLSTPCC